MLIKQLAQIQGRCGTRNADLPVWNQPAGGLDVINQVKRLVRRKPKEIGAFEAKPWLSELLEQVRKRATFRITMSGQRLANAQPGRFEPAGSAGVKGVW